MMPNRSVIVVAISLLAPASYATEKGKAAPSPTADIEFFNGQSIKDCMAMWDPVTHMTKAQWRTTCDRIRAERLPYLDGKHVE